MTCSADALSKLEKMRLTLLVSHAKMSCSSPCSRYPCLFVNENLTQPRKQLFWKTKQKAKELGFKFFWTNNGQIYVRENEDSEKIQVKTENDLNNL